MARSPRLKDFYAIIGVIVAALAPVPGSADPGSVDLTGLRGALRTIEADVRAGLTTPADVAGLWDTLLTVQPKPEDTLTTAQAPLPEAAPAAKSLFGTTFLSSASAQVPAPQTNAPNAPAPGGALFSKQPSQTVPADAAIAPLPAPSFGAVPQFGVAKSTQSQTASARLAPQAVDVANFRLMLATLSQTYTGQNATAVVNAQGPRGPVAISVRSGTVGLADIQSYASALGMPPQADGTMTAPVIIWPGATLRLNPGERLALARDAGAFVLSMGTLDINGALIEVTGPENPHTPSFNSFVTVTGGGSMTIKGATLRNLGFGQTAKFSGLSVASNLLTQDKGKVVIQDSLFDGLLNLTIAGVSGAQLSGNTFVNARDNTLNLINAPQAVIEKNLFTGGSHTNAIRVDRGSHQTRISKNIVLTGRRVAMLITGSSDHVQVRENVIWKRDGAGIKFLNTQCGLAQGNMILDNRQKGIEVRKSDGTVVDGNLIAGNGSAGIWVSAQKRDARTMLGGNALVANASGLSAATAAEILMDNNDFSRQLPRLLDGDISRLTQNVVIDLRGTVPLRIKNGQVDKDITIGSLCGDDL